MTDQFDAEGDWLRLHEIEMELDKTDPRESPPYRNARVKLNREKRRILRRMEGADPMCAVAGKLKDGKLRYNQLTEEEKRIYRVKKSVLRILQLIDKSTGPKWWEQYK